MSDRAAAILATMLGGGTWKSHYLSPNYYFSSEGFAARATTRKGQLRICLLKGCSAGLGYRAISYPVGSGKYGRIYIHRAVCELFNGPAKDGHTVVRHLDCNMQNNRANNLAWGTAADNAKDAIRMGKTCPGERNGMSKLTADNVVAMRRERAETNKTYKQLAADFGVSTMTAFRAATGQSWN